MHNIIFFNNFLATAIKAWQRFQFCIIFLVLSVSQKKRIVEAGQYCINSFGPNNRVNSETSKSRNSEIQLAKGLIFLEYL